MNACRRCLATDATLNVVIGRDGSCTLCRAHDRIGPALGDYAARNPLLEQRFAAVAGRHCYDALVGLSGGKDSSHVALRLARRHGLRLLLCTYDNGYLTDTAVRNIERMVKALGQDHCFVGPGPELQSAIARASMRRFGIPCVGCTFPGILAVIKVAMDRGIPFIVHGRTPAQMFKELAPGSMDPFLPFLAGNFRARNVEANRRFMTAVVRRLSRRFRWFLDGEWDGQPEWRAEAERLYAPDPARLAVLEDPPEILGYYLYEPHDEVRIVAELEREVQWQRPADSRPMGHEDCRVHAAAVYLHTIKYGYPILQPELAAMVRMGAISRAGAAARLERETEAWECDRESMAALSSVSGLGPDELAGFAARSRRVLAFLRPVWRWRQEWCGRWLAMPLPVGRRFETPVG